MRRFHVLAVSHLLFLAAAGSACTDMRAANDHDAPETSGPTLMLLLTGDVMLGRGIDQILRHSVDPVIYEPYVRSALGYVELAEKESGRIPREVAPEYVWGDALDVLRRFDPAVRIINLETAVTTADEPWPGKGIQYRMHPANVDVLAAARIDCAVLANNHVLDWGREGLLESLRAVRGAGVAVAGAGADAAEAARPVTIPVEDGRVILFAMADESSGVPPAWAASPDRPGVHFLPDLSVRTARKVAQQIRDHERLPGDRVVVSIHWGGNWGYAVPAEQERFAKTLIDEGGVDLVHGHSSHHPKRIEVYRDRLILYGAGDLINDYEGIGGYEEYRPDLAMLYLPKLTPDGAFDSMILAPMRVRRFRLERAATEDTEWLRRRVQREAVGATVDLDSDGLLVVAPAPPG
ncbi:MAG: CapA family protein [Thermoanaerobaculia bacterium]